MPFTEGEAGARCSAPLSWSPCLLCTGNCAETLCCYPAAITEPPPHLCSFTLRPSKPEYVRLSPSSPPLQAFGLFLSQEGAFWAQRRNLAVAPQGAVRYNHLPRSHSRDGAAQQENKPQASLSRGFSEVSADTPWPRCNVSAVFGDRLLYQSPTAGRRCQGSFAALSADANRNAARRTPACLKTEGLHLPERGFN